MTQSEASKLAAKLFAGYPFRPEELTVVVYVEQMMTCENPEWMLEAVNKMLRHEPRLPPISVVLENYKAVKERHPQVALNEPPMTEAEKAEGLAAAREFLDRIGGSV